MSILRLSAGKWALLFVLLFSVLAGCGGQQTSEGEGDAGAPSSGETVIAEYYTPESGDAPSGSSAPESDAAESQPDAGMTVSESVQFIKNLSPAGLGLEGDSMADYLVYPADGIVMVDGLAYVKLFVYTISETTQTNHIEGIYLLSRDNTRLYSLDIDADAIQELPISR